MTLFIKEIEFKGFKSFYSKTSIPFKPGLSVIIGPNGSGKSNIVDALLFVFGETSRKELRTERFEHLIFSGSEKTPAAKFAEVRVRINNESKVLPVDSDEVIISRRVDREGRSIYRINGKRETREAIANLLSHANIGSFNIVKQGEIAKLVELTPMERKNLIDEIAGISFFEEKKAKSLKELEKVESKLKEVAILLTEKRKYLEELENEKREAESFLKLKEKVEFLKRAILAKEIEERKKEVEKWNSKLQELETERKEIEAAISNLESQKEELNSKLKEINKALDLAGEKEQIELRRQLIDVTNQVNFLKTKIGNLEKELSRLRARRENVSRELEELKTKESSLVREIEELNEDIPKLEKKKAEFERLMEIALKYEKYKEMQRKLKLKDELDLLTPKLNSLKKKVDELSKEVDILREEKLRLSNTLSISRDRIISFILSLKNEIPGIVAPLTDMIKLDDKLREMIPDELLDVVVVEDKQDAIKCIKKLRENKVGVASFILKKDFKGDILKTFDLTIGDLDEIIGRRGLTKDGIFVDGILIKGGYKRTRFTAREIREMKEKYELIDKRLKDKEVQLNEIRKEFFRIKSRVEFLKEETKDIVFVEPVEEVEIDKIKPEFDKISEDLNSLHLLLKTKENELENIVRKDIKRMNDVLKELDKEEVRLEKELSLAKTELGEKEKILEEVERREKIFFDKIKGMKKERDGIIKEISKISKEIEKEKAKIFKVSSQINDVRIKLAQSKSKLEALESNVSESELPKVDKSKAELEKKLKESEEKLKRYKFVNLKALEIYEEVEKEYSELKSRVDKVKEEKAKILNAIAEIERKKLEKFMQVFNEINESFQQIYSQLTEGKARLILENEENPLEGGVDIEANPKGKMVNVRALSGGEKTLVALAFLLAIQKLLLAPFYVFDEVDAALDKMNSEKLAKLLKDASKTTQIIIISHNDAIISEADQLYGVSMNENGESQIISLKL